MPFSLSVSAVVIFYLISGYTMGIKFKKYLFQTSKPKKLFFLDRFLRVFPLFILVLVVTMFIEDSFNQLNFKQIFMNFTLLPLNLYMIFPIQMVLPITYSLSLEEQFYLIMPFLLSTKNVENTLKKVAVFSLIFIGISILLAILANYSIRVSQIFGDIGMVFLADYLVYRLLPGTIVIFILGICLNFKTKTEINITKAISVFYIIILFIISIFSIAHRGQIFAVCIGVLTGIPIVMLVKNLQRNRIDEFVGSLSYPIFLLQDPVRILIKKNFEFQETWQINLICFSITLVVSLILAKTVEQWLSAYRANFSKKFTKKHPYVVV